MYVSCKNKKSEFKTEMRNNNIIKIENNTEGGEVTIICVVSLHLGCSKCFIRSNFISNHQLQPGVGCV